jgi:hypothetical protein
MHTIICSFCRIRLWPSFCKRARRLRSERICSWHRRYALSVNQTKIANFWAHEQVCIEIIQIKVFGRNSHFIFPKATCESLCFCSTLCQMRSICSHFLTTGILPGERDAVGDGPRGTAHTDRVTDAGTSHGRDESAPRRRRACAGARESRNVWFIVIRFHCTRIRSKHSQSWFASSM